RVAQRPSRLRVTQWVGTIRGAGAYKVAITSASFEAQARSQVCAQRRAACCVSTACTVHGIRARRALPESGFVSTDDVCEQVGERDRRVILEACKLVSDAPVDP